MGISTRNHEGYSDPTAYQAVKNIEYREKVFRISYPTGYMDLYLESFFPATLERAKKVFRLIDQHSSTADKLRLRDFLLKKYERLGVLEKMYAAKTDAAKRRFQEAQHLSVHERSTARLEYVNEEAKLREASRLRKRLHRNIELFNERVTL